MRLLRESSVMDYQVIDNFLPKDQFNHLQELLTGPWFPWYYNNTSVGEGDGNGRHKHSVYNPKTGSLTEYLPYFDNCQGKLGVKKLHRILVNSVGPSFLFRKNTGFHTDDIPCPYTSIFYINTNNGYTIFEGGDKIKCVANRMLIFDSSLKHAAVTCTDKPRRIVVNFNYE